MDSEFPPAPQIDGEAMLEIFVHHSIKFAGMPMNPDSPYGDGVRLAAVGGKMLEAVYMDILFQKRPMLKAEEMEAELDKLPEQVDKWVEGYKWREKVRHAADVDMKDPKETRYIMDAYVGAVYVGGGFAAVMNWISRLVDPQAASTCQEPEQKRVKSEPSAAYNAYPPFTAQPQFQYNNTYGIPPQPAAPPPPMNPPPPLPAFNPLAPAQPQSAFLPLFNQTAQQRRLEVQYPAQFSGPAHAGRWTVQCLVNGFEKGIGTGPSKQLAKEEAARQAYHAMGWAPRSCSSEPHDLLALPCSHMLSRCLSLHRRNDNTQLHESFVPL
ncbi:hypothetical protein L227DRAFT_507228 [Lentinus tigrinus ALCF2SS1-6]|uniref:DRBM domain-containing protein n=2 Tax=Lentinus tigrinus TaxID=5365 RepID=A0A5C2S2G8_9APHY|nr:hypothetical protein L227DRAFT_507228 [Lentinus tigrinus ALCF2SS1-6]